MPLLNGQVAELTRAVIVGLRVFCRAVYRRTATGNGLGLDDYITLFCMVVFLVTCIFVTISSHRGLGRHMASLSTEQIKQSLKWSLITSAVLVWTFSLPKFAIISTLQRILCPGIKTTILFWTLALSCQACILATSVWWFKQCDPVERNWDLSIEGQCADISILKNLGYFTSAYSSFLDLFFAVYPAPFIMRLNMPLKTRLAFASAMGLSVLGCFVSLYKLIIFGQVFEIMETDPTCRHYTLSFLHYLTMLFTDTNETQTPFLTSASSVSLRALSWLSACPFQLSALYAAWPAAGHPTVKATTSPHSPTQATSSQEAATTYTIIAATATRSITTVCPLSRPPPATFSAANLSSRSSSPETTTRLPLETSARGSHPHRPKACICARVSMRYRW